MRRKMRKYQETESEKKDRPETPDYLELLSRLEECERRLDLYDSSYPSIGEEANGNTT